MSRSALENEMVTAALDHLAGAGLVVKDVSRARAADLGTDAYLLLRTPAGVSQLYHVQTKTRVAPSTALNLRPAKDGRTLVVTTYVPESVADYWRGQDIHYVDTAGNMYIRLEGIIVDVRGRKRPSSPQPAELGKPLRTFKPSGLKIVFSLLAQPATVNASYREIAQTSGTSLGTVQWVYKELEELGYVTQGSRIRDLHRTRELLNRWADAYTLDLGPRLTLARLDAPDPMWWNNADKALIAENAQWGGETAAHFINPHLRPGRAVLYASAVPGRLAAKYRLRKAQGVGDVEIRQRFWHLEEQEQSLIVPTPLIYADLIASADPRQLEAAANLREHDELLRRLDRG